MRRITVLFLFSVIVSHSILARDYHVSMQGNNNNDGTISGPFRTISFAADKAQAGDVIIIHEGVYREWINPPRGGESDEKRIVYRSAKGEKVVIKGSEVLTGWKKFRNDVWKVVIPNSFFGDFNPYKEIIHGDWFADKGRIHHPGEVYLNGRSLYESASLENLLKPATLEVDGTTLYPWYCETDKENTYIYANFNGHNPNKDLVEINVREACFYPENPGMNYITVKGLILQQAATPWAPPTAEQIGLLGTHWSKGWIIEDNVISDSKCVGITLGKDRKSGQNVWSKNRCKDGATHYNEVIFRAFNEGWSKENIGSHVVRNNTIYNCEQAGIVGSLGAVFSRIYDNHIYNIWTKRLFTGAEIAGIKIHAPIDALIQHNRIHNTGRGIWLDWMTQGTRVTRNLCYDNTVNDLFVEVSHGPFLVDNNIFLSKESIRNWSEGSMFVHNLLAGRIMAIEVLNRFTPYHFPHSTKVKGLRNTYSGRQQFYNNLFLSPLVRPPEDQNPVHYDKDYGLVIYNKLSYEVKARGNVYTGAARPYRLEPDFVQTEKFDADIQLTEESDHVYLQFSLPEEIDKGSRPFITTEFLGKTKISELIIENPDGSKIRIDKDYIGQSRNEQNPSAGPFEIINEGLLRLKIW
jgi:hypothetical protein